MFGRLLRVTCTVLVIAVAFAIPGLVTSAPASADTVVDGCTIVSNPTPTNFTNCPGADLSGTNLAGINLSYANLAGAIFVGNGSGTCADPTCDPADLSGANLSNANLSGATFFAQGIVPPCCLQLASGAADLETANLSGANLGNADITQVDLINADLTNANLSGATLTGATLTGATLTGADLTGTPLIPGSRSLAATSAAGATVTWPTPQSLPGATPGTCTSPSGSTFPFFGTTVTCQVLDDHGDVATGTFTVDVEPVLTTTEVSSSSPSLMQVGQPASYSAIVFLSSRGEGAPTGGTLTFTDNGVPISGCSALPLANDGTDSCSTTLDVTGLNDISATYSGSGVFAGSTTSPFRLEQQIVTRTPCTSLAGCNLHGLNLSVGNTFQPAYIDLSGANLEGANLSDANLNEANLRGANLQGADLSGADLTGADLTGVNLEGADLTNSFISDVRLIDANLTGANFSGAAVFVSNLTGANLHKAINLSTALFEVVTCPDGTDSDYDGGSCLGHL